MRLFLLSATLLFSSYLFAQTCPTQSTPFQNVSIAPNCTMTSNFSFGAFNQLFCFTNFPQPAGVITWPSGGGTSAGNLPIFLSVNPIYEGQAVNKSGTLLIKNNQAQTMIVSCLYTF